MPDLVIFGTSAFAEIAHYYFSEDSDYTVVGFTVDGAFVEESTFRGLPVVPFEEVETQFAPTGHHLFVAVGYHELNDQRARKMAEAESKGFELASFVSSKADVGADLVLPPNAMVQERAVLQPFVKIGRGTILWSTTRIGFHTQIGDYCWLVCPIFGESVQVGDRSFIGLNATIGPSITIGRRNVIGAGALVLKSTGDDEVFRGARSVASKVPSTKLRF